MAKAPKKLSFTETHDRVGLKIRWNVADTLYLGSSRGRDAVNATGAAGGLVMKACGKLFFAAIKDAVTVGAVFERLQVLAEPTKGPEAFLVAFTEDVKTGMGGAIKIAKAKNGHPAIKKITFEATDGPDLEVVADPPGDDKPAPAKPGKTARAQPALFKKGDKCEAKWSGTWYACTYGKKNADGTHHIYWVGENAGEHEDVKEVR